MKNIRLLVACAVWCSILTACGGSSSSNPAQSNAFKVESKSQVVGATGGSVTQTLTDGTVFKLDVPAGALTSSTTLSLTTQQPVEGQRFNLLLQPAGLVLANGTAATLTVTLPSGQTLPAAGGLAYDGVLVPYTTLPDGRLEIKVSHFAGTAVAKTTMSKFSELLFKTVNMTPSVNACGSAPFLATSNGGIVAVDAVTIELYGQCMIGTIQALANTGQYAEAVSVADSVAAYLQRTGSGDPGGFVTQASTIACTAYESALNFARNTTVTTTGILYPVIRPVLYWETVIQKLGATCARIPATEYQTVVHAKVSESLTYYSTAKPTIIKTSSSNYTDAKNEAGWSSRTKNEVLSLSPAAAVSSTVTAEIVQRAQPGILDAMLQAPWNLCRDSVDYSELLYLMLTMDSPDAVKNAAQYCGTQFTAAMKDTNGTVTAQLAQPLGGVSASETRASGSITAAKNAKLTINGPIQALQCPLGVATGIQSESLTIKIDGTTLQTLTTSPYLATPLEIDLTTALEAAHPGATAQLSKAAVTIERTGTSCADFWGANPVPLLNLTLNLGSAKILFEASEPHQGDLYAVSPDGSGLTKLGHGVTPSYIQWFSNYTKISFQGTDINGGITYWSMNPDGSGLTQIQLPLRVSDTNPTWSPDGRRVAFYQNNISTFNNPICIWNTDGSGQNCFQPVGLGYWGPDRPSWSPDGTRITFSYISVDPSYIGQNIFVMNVDGSGVVKLTNYPDFPQASYPAWSPDGSKIAFSITNTNISYGLSGSNIFVMNTDGTGLVQLTTDNLSEGPVWSPDGTQIAYTYGLGVGFSRNYIRVMKADGSRQVPVAQGSLPAWR
jgi:hypothetical protein